MGRLAYVPSSRGSNLEVSPIKPKIMSARTPHNPNNHKHSFIETLPLSLIVPTNILYGWNPPYGPSFTPTICFPNVCVCVRVSPFMTDTRTEIRLTLLCLSSSVLT